MFKRLFRYLPSALIAALCLIPAATQAASRAATIEFSHPSERVRYINHLCHHLTDLAREYGVVVNQKTCDSNAATQLEQLEMVSADDVAYVVRPVDGLDAQKIVDIIKPRNQTLVFLTTPPPAEVLAGYPEAWFVGESKTELASTFAREIVAYLKAHPETDQNGDGTLDILVLHGPAQHVDEISRFSAVKKALSESGLKYRFVHEIYADWFHERAGLHIKHLLSTGRFSEVDAIVSMNDDMAMASLEAIDQAEEQRWLPIFSVDGIKEAIEAVREGRLVMTVSHDIITVARVIYAITQGATDELKMFALTSRPFEGHTVLVNSKVITRDNAAYELSRHPAHPN